MYVSTGFLRTCRALMRSFGQDRLTAHDKPGLKFGNEQRVVIYVNLCPRPETFR